MARKKGWMILGDIRAIYYKNDDLFILYDPTYRHNWPLEVSHWLAIPDFKIEPCTES